MKNLIKMAFAVVAFAAVGLCSYKAYGSYTAANMSEEDLLIAENIEALAQKAGEGKGKDRYVCKSLQSGNCMELYEKKKWKTNETAYSYWLHILYSYRQSDKYKWESTETRKAKDSNDKDDCLGYPLECPSGYAAAGAEDWESTLYISKSH